jgi:hypothetical protein
MHHTDEPTAAEHVLSLEAYTEALADRIQPVDAYELSVVRRLASIDLRLLQTARWRTHLAAAAPRPFRESPVTARLRVRESRLYDARQATLYTLRRLRGHRIPAIPPQLAATLSLRLGNPPKRESELAPAN